jgi:N-formylglutamate deformylase
VSDLPLPCEIRREFEGPLVAAAIHAGHAVRPQMAELLAIDEATRLREEDPFTAVWTLVAPIRVVGTVSRFEVDLNRPRSGAVYRTPEEAWGLDLWNEPLPEALIESSLHRYDAFYTEVGRLLDEVNQRYGRFAVLDLHSYNYRRDGAGSPAADPMLNPDVNVGTGSLDRARWAPVIDRFLAEMAGFDYPAGRLDVRENVRFRGGHFAAWIHRRYPESGCAIAVEVKKFFMDEWTGEVFPEHLEAIGRALGAAAAGGVGGPRPRAGR